MVLQKALGLSDREAVAAFQFDILGSTPVVASISTIRGSSTVLSGMRARLASSDDPDRIFNALVDVAKAAGLIGRKRVMDSAPIYDVGRKPGDTVDDPLSDPGAPKIVDPDLKAELQAVLQRDADDYRLLGNRSVIGRTPTPGSNSSMRSPPMGTGAWRCWTAGNSKGRSPGPPVCRRWSAKTSRLMPMAGS